MEEQRLEPEASVHGFLGRNSKSSPQVAQQGSCPGISSWSLDKTNAPPRHCANTMHRSKGRKRLIPTPLAWNASSPSGLTGVRVRRPGNLSGQSRSQGQQEVVSYCTTWGSPVSFSRTVCPFALFIISLY